MIWILFAYTPLLVAWLVVARSTTGLLTPDGLFVLFNSFTLFGTYFVIDPASQIDRRYLFLLAGLTGVYVTGSLAWKIALPGRTADAPTPPTPISNTILALYGLSLLVTVAYYTAVGRITLIDSFTGGASFDAATARLNSYAGTTYYAPGFANQFKNALLPALTISIIFTLWRERVPGRLGWSVLMTVIAIVAAGGTGQRAPLVIALLVAFIALIRARRIAPRHVVQFALGFFILFSFATTLGQRVQLAQANSRIEALVLLFDSLWSRIFLVTPNAGRAAHLYTSFLPQANGADWGADILSVLPGRRASTLSNQVFAMLWGGSTRGTTPPSIWGSLDYNFGLFGALLVTCVLVVCYGLLTRLYLRPSFNQSFLTVVALSGMAVSGGAWVAGSVLTILNQGFVAYAFLYVIARHLDRLHGSSQSGRRLAQSPPEQTADQPNPPRVLAGSG